MEERKKLNILITGANGFIGKNLTAELQSKHNHHLLLYDLDTSEDKLMEYCQQCDFVIHLAGINRPQKIDEFMQGNCGFTDKLLQYLKEAGNTCPILLSSSTQATLDNLYGQSKKASEDLVFTYSQETGAKVLVYRFPNIFGKWCQPNYNSAIATFCYNLSRTIPITVNDPSAELTLVYIDDVIEEIVLALQGKEHRNGQYCEVPVTYKVLLGDIVSLLESFVQSRNNKQIPDLADDFIRKLYSTYISYLPAENDGFRYPLDMHTDARGIFAEMLRTPDRGQASVNVSKPGVIKGNHWHHTKTEKFLVVTGTGVIRFRKVGSDQVYTYNVSGDRLEVLDIPPGYTHNIENIGDTDMVTLMWASECYDPDKPDTFFLEV